MGSLWCCTWIACYGFKKLIILLAIAWFGLSNLNAQEFKIGASLGLPLADAADISSFVLGVDAYYYFTKQDAFFQFGANVGFRNFFIDDDFEIIDFKDGQSIWFKSYTTPLDKVFKILKYRTVYENRIV